MSNAATRLIVIYRNYLSSYKGFSCAHRVLKGSSSCSEYGLKCTERYGVLMGSRLTLRRLLDCREVHQKWVQSQEKDDDGIRATSSTAEVAYRSIQEFSNSVHVSHNSISGGF